MQELDKARLRRLTIAVHDAKRVKKQDDKASFWENALVYFRSPPVLIFLGIVVVIIVGWSGS